MAATFIPAIKHKSHDSPLTWRVAAEAEGYGTLVLDCLALKQLDKFSVAYTFASGITSA